MRMPVCPCPTPPCTDAMALHCVITTDAECETRSFRMPAEVIPGWGTCHTTSGYRPGKRFLAIGEDTGPRLSIPPLTKICSLMRSYAGVLRGVSVVLRENVLICGGLRAESK